jgi:uncharacterized protein YqgV (UPF0045/DUF77 family)
LKTEIDASFTTVNNNINDISNNLDNYYLKTEIDANFTTVNNNINDISNNLDNYYLKTEIDASFTAVNNNITEISNNLDNYYLKTEIDASFTALEQNITTNDISMSGRLQGPSNFYIDPAPYGIDNEDGKGGTVIIRGNLQVDGSYTIIDSNRLDISDTNIVLAKNASDLQQADGAGIKIMDETGPSITYDSATTNWVFNRDISAQDISAQYISAQDISAQDISANSIESSSLAIKDVANININTDVIMKQTVYAKKFIFSKHI